MSNSGARCCPFFPWWHRQFFPWRTQSLRSLSGLTFLFFDTGASRLMSGDTHRLSILSKVDRSITILGFNASHSITTCYGLNHDQKMEYSVAPMPSSVITGFRIDYNTAKRINAVTWWMWEKIIMIFFYHVYDKSRCNRFCNMIDNGGWKCF